MAQRKVRCNAEVTQVVLVVGEARTADLLGAKVDLEDRRLVDGTV